MRILIKIGIIFFIFIGLAYIALWGFVNLKGKEILSKKLSQLTNSSVSIEKVKFLPPLGAEIDNLSQENIKLPRLSLTLDLLKILKGRVSFNLVRVEGLRITLIKRNDKPLQRKLSFLSLFPPERKPFLKNNLKREGPLQLNSLEDVKEKPQAEIIPVFIKRLIFDRARIDFYEKSQEKTFNLSLLNIKATVLNLSSSLEDKVLFRVYSDLLVEGQLFKKNVEFNGWLDWKNKATNSSLRIKEIPYGKFSFYYPEKWKPENLGLKQAILSLKADFKGANNKLLIKGQIRLEEYEFEEGPEEPSLLQTIINIFKEEEKPVFNFELKTRLDKPQLDFSQIAAQMKDKVGPITLQIGKEAVSKVLKKGTETLKKNMDITTNTTVKVLGVITETIEKILDIPGKTKEIFKESGKVLKDLLESGKESENKTQTVPVEN